MSDDYWAGRCLICGHPYEWFTDGEGIHQCPPSLTSDGPLGFIPTPPATPEETE